MKLPPFRGLGMRLLSFRSLGMRLPPLQGSGHETTPLQESGYETCSLPHTHVLVPLSNDHVALVGLQLLSGFTSIFIITMPNSSDYGQGGWTQSHVVAQSPFYVKHWWKKTLRSSQDSNLGPLNSGQMLLPTEPLEALGQRIDGIYP